MNMKNTQPHKEIQIIFFVWPSYLMIYKNKYSGEDAVETY